MYACGGSVHIFDPYCLLVSTSVEPWLILYIAKKVYPHGDVDIKYPKIDHVCQLSLA